MAVAPGEREFWWAVLQGPAPRAGNDIEFLVDNEAAWGRLADDLAAARNSVRAMLFMLDLPHVRLKFGRPVPGNPGAAGGVRLEESLLRAAQRGVDVGILINDVQPAISPANTTRAVMRYFRRHDLAGRVRLARLRTPQGVPIHAKVFVIDDRVAYLLGSVFAQDYFDGREHRIDDPRRGHLHWRSLVRAPVHDVSARVEGPIVADLTATFELHSEYATRGAGHRDAPSRAPAQPTAPITGDVTLQVTRTLHGARYRGLPQGETGIFESYRRALEAARRYIYLENQYFTCVEVVDALIAALLRAPDLQLIVVLNHRLGIPGYDRWQREAIERLMSGLGAHASRVGLFTLWSFEPPPTGSHRPVVLGTYVHSKVAIVDDQWLTAGSANLDGLSLLASEHMRRWPMRSRLGRLVGLFGGGDPALARSTEINVTLAGEAATRPAQIGRLRRELWAEHLGRGTNVEQEPAGGWLSLWHQRAGEKLAAMRAGDPAATTSRILPFPVVDGRLPSGLERPANYVRALGLPVDELDVRLQFRSFAFNDGRSR